MTLKGMSAKTPLPEVQPVTTLPNSSWWLRFTARVRHFLEDSQVVAPRRGRQEVWRAQDRGELVPAQVDLGMQGSTIVATARPRASMVLRVYREATKTWEAPIVVDSVDIRPINKE